MEIIENIDLEESDELFIIDDLDLGDETELKKAVSCVESLAKLPGSPGTRVSVLTTEQWQTATQRMLPPAMRRGAAHLYIHVLRDSKDPRHLLVSPSCVQGINEGSVLMYQDVVYGALRCLETNLVNLLNRGLNDILAEAVAKKLKIKIFSKNYPREALLVRGLLSVLSEFGYQELDWAIELRRQPKRCILALTKTDFSRGWAADDKKPIDLAQLLLDSKLNFDQDLLIYTEEHLKIYLESRG